MRVPLILTGMKQPHQLPIWLDQRCQVWPLLKIATSARKAQIAFAVIQHMLARFYVFNMKSQKWRRRLRQSAVFATVVRSISDELTQRLIHRG